MKIQTFDGRAAAAAKPALQYEEITETIALFDLIRSAGAD